jgi:hypothetical protein
VANELWDVFTAIAKGRQVKSDDVDAVIQVGAKATAGHLRLEVACGRGYHPDVNDTVSVVADAPNLAFLERAKQLHLKWWRELTDLVEEERAAVSFLKETDLLRRGTGEGALRVSKELALQQVLRNGATVDGDERLLGARAVGMDVPSDQFLAGATLARNEDGRRVPCNLTSNGQDLLHRCAASDDATRRTERGQLLLELLHRLAQPFPLDRLADGQQQLVGAKRLSDEVVRATPHRLDDPFVVLVGAHHDDEPTGVLGAKLLKELEPVHARHAHVAQNEIRRGAVDRL